MSDTHRRYIINDENDRLAIPGSNCTGLDLSGRVADSAGFAYSGFSEKFDPAWLVPRDQWQARIEERKAKQERIIDLVRHEKLPHKDQGRTNYCWINAPVHALELSRRQANEDWVSLSPAWGGSIIKKGRNVGGWGREAIEFLYNSGTVPSSVCGDNDQSVRHNTGGNRKTALRYRVTDWVECQPRNVEQMVSMLLRGYCGAGGYNWWGHEVALTDVDWIDGEPAVIIRNSWRGWGDFGFGVLQGSRMLADDLVFCVAGRPMGAMS